MCAKISKTWKIKNKRGKVGHRSAAQLVTGMNVLNLNAMICTMMYTILNGLLYIGYIFQWVVKKVVYVLNHVQKMSI